jgi:hypothetical protein
LSELIKKFPDEDEIEKVLEAVHNVGWNNLSLSDKEKATLSMNFRRMLEAWSAKYLGKSDLLEIVGQNYLPHLSDSPTRVDIYRELDLVICFFQHYIYAFEEFMTREFRDSVIRCGLVCERLVKRIAVADNHPEVNTLFKFEDRANKLASLLSHRVPEIQFLVNRMKYIYSKRTEKGAHDTGAAGILVAKSCISEIPIAYMEYLDALEKIGFKICAKDDLIKLVNSTVEISTTMIVTKQGEPAKPESILTSMYSNSFFVQPRKLSEIQFILGEQGHNIPKPLLFKTLDGLCKKRMLLRKGRGFYVQRTPPSIYFASKIVE